MLQRECLCGGGGCGGAAARRTQQQDFYSANFTPLPSLFSFKFPTVGTVTAATLTYRTYGLQASAFGPFLTTFNGNAVTGFIDFEDGPTSINDRSYTLSNSQLADLNSWGYLDISVNRNGSNDAIAFDYMQLDYRATNSVVPEPSTYMLMAAGLVAVGTFSRRRRRRTA